MKKLFYANKIFPFVCILQRVATDMGALKLVLPAQSTCLANLYSQGVCIQSKLPIVLRPEVGE